MKFRDFFSLKQILFTVLVLAVFIVLGVLDSGRQVKVSFDDTVVKVRSDYYQLEIPYEMIASAELEQLSEAGREVENCVDDKIVRTGCWENDAWGQYYICADMDVQNCVVVRLDDGRVFVFSRKNETETEKLYQTLQTYL